MLKELQEFGLSEKEAKVYLASLEIGKATADQLAKRAEVIRSTTYVQIESLMKQGLMSSYEEGKKTYFTAESPQYLLTLFEKKKALFEAQKNDLTRVLPDLVRLHESAGERPLVRFFAGKEGITAMRDESLKDLGKDDVLRVLYSYDALLNIYSLEEVVDFSERREKKGIKLKIMYSRKDGRLAEQATGPSYERRYLSSGTWETNTDFFIFGDKVALMALSGSIFGLIIQSSVIADSMRHLFDIVWNVAEKED